MTGIGEGANKVLVSDAQGNASWQDLITPAVGVSVTGIGAITLPTNTFMTINQWGSVISQDGGSNYNAANGTYTLPVAGIYSIDAAVSWNALAAPAANMHIALLVNGNAETRTFVAAELANLPSDMVLHYTRRFTAGTVISFQIYQDSGSNATVFGGTQNKFSVYFIHR